MNDFLDKHMLTLLFTDYNIQNKRIKLIYYCLSVIYTERIIGLTYQGLIEVEYCIYICPQNCYSFKVLSR